MTARRFVLVLAIALIAAAGPAAAADDPAPGTRFSVDPDALPEPFASRSAANGPAVVRRPANVAPRVPEGFAATLFADGLRHARWLYAGPGGDLFLAQGKAGEITRLRDADGDGKAETVETFAHGFKRPTGMAIHDGRFWVADLRGVWTAPFRPGDHVPGTFSLLTEPGAFGDGWGHWTRTLAIEPDGSGFLVGIGSRSNVSAEPIPFASVQAFDIDGGNRRTLASGLRNPVGLAFHPDTGVPYTVVNERDGLGDELPPDYLTSLRPGDFFGWPYAYTGGRVQPGMEGMAPDKVAATRMPEVLFAAHSAPLGLTFYDGAAFPPAYRGDAFVALHGSWNANDPRGYFVARVPFENGRPAGHYEVFASGFKLGEFGPARVWGRPVGLAVGADGALYVADDVGQTVWRIAYTGR